jgi:hypothetical protein
VHIVFSHFVLVSNQPTTGEIHFPSSVWRALIEGFSCIYCGWCSRSKVLSGFKCLDRGGSSSHCGILLGFFMLLDAGRLSICCAIVLKVCVCVWKETAELRDLRRNILAILNKLSPAPRFSMTPESTHGFIKSCPWIYHEQRAPARAPPRRYMWPNNHPTWGLLI